MAKMIKKNKSILIFVFLSVFASALNYLAYPLFSRFLPTTEYINITVSLSLFTQISAFLSSITAITIGLSKSVSDGQPANEKIELLQAFLFRLFFVIAIIFLIISPLIMTRIHTPVLFAIPIVFMMFFSIPIQIISGYFNGKNQMRKLGQATLIAAASQFIIGLITCLISHSGLMTMLSMALAQIITLILLYTIFSKDKIPEISKSLKTPIRTIKEKHMRPLLVYVACASVAIMIISLTQIADLFTVQNLNTNVKFYTDIYVISRVVFFAGMIFIWPFLGEINVNDRHFNRRPFLKLIGCFLFIAIAAITMLHFFGAPISYILFGAKYSSSLVASIGTLSILFKFFMLVITAVVLYFVVFRSYIGIWYAATVSGLVLLFSNIVNKSCNISIVLLWLDIIVGVMAVIGMFLLLRTTMGKNKLKI